MWIKIRKFLPGILVSSTLLASIAALLWLSIIATTSSGCGYTAHSLQYSGTMRGVAAASEAWTDKQCQTLHNEEIAITAVTAVVAGLSGSTGISAAFVDDPHSQQVALGVTSIVSAAVSAGGGIWLHFIQQDFGLHCMIAQDVPTPAISNAPPFVNPAAPAPKPTNVPANVSPSETPKPLMFRKDFTCPDCDWYQGKPAN